MRIQKVLPEGSNFDNVVFFLVDEGRDDPNTVISRPTSAPPAKRHLNGVSLSCR